MKKYIVNFYEVLCEEREKKGIASWASLSYH